ncbi:MAG: glycoside hydrolase family 1, partial [Bryobacterales bacterium]|nr:glycoside hydrolase family 1 [Bryobacterales bacterium]
KRKNKGIQLVHSDTAEHHRAADRRTASWVEHVNARRFLILDLILGRLGERHPLYPYMLRHGAADRDLKWFQDHPGSVSILGLDYYLHSEMEWFWNTSHDRPDIRATNQSPRGFASVAEDYVERFGLPIMLTETNIRGSVFERLSWLKFMEEQCEELVLSGQDFRGFCWYPSIDTTDWANCCTQCTRVVDPQGIWTLDSSRTTRHDSELSETYGALARGEITSADIPARPFSQELARRLRGYFPLTTGWNESVA